MLSTSFLRHLESALSKKTGKTIHIRRVSPVAGGSINSSAKLDTTAGYFFLKSNDAFKYPSMFEKEVDGLNFLRSANALKVPDVILNGEEGETAYLVLEFIAPNAHSKTFWRDFAYGLATLHKTTGEKFGYTTNNYIGSLTQSNRMHNKWVDFFVEERLEPQIKLAVNSGKLNANDVQNFKKVFFKLEEIIPVEQPSSLHGDLWNGNFISDSAGNPCLIDPAVYFGHREMDLAMTKLFGGFEDEFYSAYQEIFPFHPGFYDRVELHNLYPLLVHVNLFGGGYVGQVREIVKRFVH